MSLFYEEDEWAREEHHYACPCGCGELNDECARWMMAKPAPVQEKFDWHDYDDGPSFCRGTWKGKPCTDEAVSHGLCDIHLEKD